MFSSKELVAPPTINSAQFADGTLSDDWVFEGFNKFGRAMRCLFHTDVDCWWTRRAEEPRVGLEDIGKFRCRTGGLGDRKTSKILKKSCIKTPLARPRFALQVGGVVHFKFESSILDSVAHTSRSSIGSYTCHTPFLWKDHQVFHQCVRQIIFVRGRRSGKFPRWKRAPDADQLPLSPGQFEPVAEFFTQSTFGLKTPGSPKEGGSTHEISNFALATRMEQTLTLQAPADMLRPPELISHQHHWFNCELRRTGQVASRIRSSHRNGAVSKPDFYTYKLAHIRVSDLLPSPTLNKTHFRSMIQSSGISARNGLNLNIDPVPMGASTSMLYLTRIITSHTLGAPENWELDSIRLLNPTAIADLVLQQLGEVFPPLCTVPGIIPISATMRLWRSARFQISNGTPMPTLVHSTHIERNPMNRQRLKLIIMNAAVPRVSHSIRPLNLLFADPDHPLVQGYVTRNARRICTSVESDAVLYSSLDQIPSKVVARIITPSRGVVTIAKLSRFVARPVISRGLFNRLEYICGLLVIVRERRIQFTVKVYVRKISRPFQIQRVSELKNPILAQRPTLSLLTLGGATVPVIEPTSRNTHRHCVRFTTSIPHGVDSQAMIRGSQSSQSVSIDICATEEAAVFSWFLIMIYSETFALRGGQNIAPNISVVALTVVPLPGLWMFQFPNFNMSRFGSANDVDSVDPVDMIGVLKLSLLTSSNRALVQQIWIRCPTIGWLCIGLSNGFPRELATGSARIPAVRSFVAGFDVGVCPL
ncbi:hypothetical protein B0H14DRAFT_3166645 [Mycena olivaceomarginata]|nr:hypothetical protein B0H14DRAFT_3166645 [Mycena olivaceomarginata]